MTGLGQLHLPIIVKNISNHLSFFRTVRAFAKENLELQRYEQEMSNVLKMSQKEALVNAKFYGMTGISGNMIILTVLYYGGSLVTSDVIR